MPDQFQQTSFIPKKTYDVGPAPQTKASSLTGILSFAGVTLFVLSIVAAGGVFLYERYLETSLVRKQESLERAKSAFEPELIRELSRLDDKFVIGRQLLNAHIAPSAIFKLIEDITLQSVRFLDFSYAVTEVGVRITMNGEARSFSSVALQSDEFAKNRSLRQPEFSGLGLDARGNVVFQVTAIVDPQLISYRERASRAGGSAFFEITPINGEVAGAATSI